MASAADIQARITALEQRLAASAGVRGTMIGDQSTTFDYEGGVKELARLRHELAQVASATGSTTRYVATSKGL